LSALLGIPGLSNYEAQKTPSDSAFCIKCSNVASGGLLYLFYCRRIGQFTDAIGFKVAGCTVGGAVGGGRWVAVGGTATACGICGFDALQPTTCK